jgi:hypothetical protein
VSIITPKNFIANVFICQVFYTPLHTSSNTQNSRKAKLSGCFNFA